jgi:ComEC/Rec2-related protein
MLLAATGIFSFGVLLFAASFFLILTAVFRRTKTSTILAFCCIVLVSSVRFILSASPLSEVEINRILPELPLENVQLTGRIAGPAEYYAYRSGLRGSWVMPVKCEGIKTTNTWVRRRGTLQVRIADAAPDLNFRRGELMWFSGALQKHDYPGGEPIVLEVWGSSSLKTLSQPSHFSPVIWGHQLRERAARTLSNGIENHPDQLAVFKALVLGYRKAIPAEIHAHFSHTGTLHIFAISGLHVGIIGLLIIIVLKTIGISRAWWGVWLLPLLLVFVCSTGMKSSALRALTMAAVYFLAPLFRRKPDVPNAVALAAILLLWWQPMEILSGGFIFSFTVVSFLVMVFSGIPRKIISAGNGIFRPVRTYLASLVITSIAAFIASAPLTALFFGSFSPVSLFGNLIVVPLTFCIVLCGWLSILIPVAAGTFNHSAIVFINALLGTVGKLAEWPGAYWQVPVPSLLAVLFWYIGWIYLFTHARSAHQRSVALAWVALSIVWTAAIQII